MAWMTCYQVEESKKFEVSDGDHKVKIAKVVNEVSKTTNRNMHVITLIVEGSNGETYNDYVIEGDYYNQKMTRVFDAFKIQRGNFNFSSWLGRVGYAHFEHEEQEYNGNKFKRPVLKYYHNNVPDTPQNASGESAQMTPAEVQGVAAAFDGSVMPAETPIF